jgi:hypothetical protein
MKRTNRRRLALMFSLINLMNSMKRLVKNAYSIFGFTALKEI